LQGFTTVVLNFAMLPPCDQLVKTVFLT